MSTTFAKGNILELVNDVFTVEIECLNGSPNTGFSTTIPEETTYPDGSPLKTGDWILVMVEGQQVLPGRIFPNDPNSELDTSVPGVGKGDLIDGMEDPNADAVLPGEHGNSGDNNPVYPEEPVIQSVWVNAVPYEHAFKWLDVEGASEIPVGTSVFFYFEIEEDQMKVTEIALVEGDCSLAAES